MSNRFEELLSGMLDDELSPAEFSELTDLVSADPAQLTELQEQLEAAEMLVLSEDELHSPERFLLGLRSADEAIPAGFSPVVEVKEPNSNRFRRAAPLALAAVLAVAIVLWPSATPETPIARIQSVHGEVQWAGDGGKLQNAWPGQRIRGGTVETLSADAWAVVEFADGSAITVLGQSELMVTEDDERRKVLRLNGGVMSADVQPQPKGLPMLVRTPAAEIEVVGTQFNLDAESSRTTLAVSEGLVRLMRLTDGEVVDVPANHQAVASVEEDSGLQVTTRGPASSSWHSELAKDANHGKWVPDLWALADKLKKAVASGELNRKEAVANYKAAAELDDDAGMLYAMPWLRKQLKAGSNTDVSYLAALSVTRGQSAPVVANSRSKFRIVGQAAASVAVTFGITTLGPDGSFAGKYFVARTIEVSKSGGIFDVEIPLLDFQPLATKKVSQSPRDEELVDWWCITKNKKAKLAIRRVELLSEAP